MQTPEQIRRTAVIKELYVSVIGWAWMAAAVATLYFLVRAIFFGGSWWFFLGSAAVAWLLYRVSLHYQLENERAWREPAKTETHLPK